MNQNTFCMAGGVARNPLVRLAKPITATIGANEHIAIVGPNGGGKSLVCRYPDRINIHCVMEPCNMIFLPLPPRLFMIM